MKTIVKKSSFFGKIKKNWKLILVIVLFITIYASLNVPMELFKNQDINIEQYDFQ